MLSRRRFVSIAASAAALPMLSPHATAAPAPVVWRGVAMGAMASMTLLHPDRDEGRRLIERCLAEISRLEAIFSLYRSDSALVRLNRQGVLEDPPLELVELLSFAASLARHSDGAFDVTVQPLFELHARHFAEPGADPAGPPPARIAEALELVDHRAVDVASDRIALGRPGMKLTLNGIAQGYVTDCVAALLAAAGLENLLLNLGELRAAGSHPDGRAWSAAIADPAAPGDTFLAVDLRERPGFPALATSGAYGMYFDPERRHHHLFDTSTGRGANQHASVSTAAPNAMLADALSTTLAVATPDRCARIMETYAPARAYLIGSDGKMTRLVASA